MENDSKWSLISLFNGLIVLTLGAMLVHQISLGDKMHSDYKDLKDKVMQLDSISTEQTRRIDSLMNMHPYKTSPKK